MVQPTGRVAAQSERPADDPQIGGAAFIEGVNDGRETHDQDGNLPALAETTGLTKQQVGSLFDELSKLIGKNLGNDGPGSFAIPGLLQIKVVRKPATEEHKGINPFTKEEMVIKAKPAKNVVKVTALKGLKDLV
jgi:nucleoid DNA-binding protein